MPFSPSRSYLAEDLQAHAAALYKAAICFAFAVSVIHAVSLPILVTFDGYWYARLAEALGTPRFSGEWDYLRTPLFPALLKCSFWLLGRRALTVIAVQTALGFAGICLLGAALRRLGRTIEAALAIVLLSVFPTLIAYEHALLTETGTFFFLALALYVGTAPARRPAWRTAGLIVVIALGYYERSTLLLMAPVLAFLHLLAARWSGSAPDSVPRRPLRITAAEAVALVVVPFLLAYPWLKNPRVIERNGQSVLLYGMIRQTLIPVDDPIWGKSGAIYSDAIRQSRVKGGLPLSGLRDDLVYPALGVLYPYGAEASRLFTRMIVHRTGAYAEAVGRNILLFAGAGTQPGDSAEFRAAVLSGAGSVVAPRPAGFPPLNVDMAEKTRWPSAGAALAAVAPEYDILVFLSFPATVVLLAMGFHRKDGPMVAFALVPIAFLAINALALTSQDRTAVPAFPLLLLDVVAVPACIWRGNSN
jgi:4-amino-4-deoxy-L-arabinose transferase-like glycosyltransferase